MWGHYQKGVYSPIGFADETTQIEERLEYSRRASVHKLCVSRHKHDCRVMKLRCIETQKIVEIARKGLLVTTRDLVY